MAKLKVAAIAIFFLLAFVFFFVLAPIQTQSLEQNYSKILTVLEKNNVSEERFFEAKLVLTENGEMKNDFSPTAFDALEGDLIELKNEFLKMDSSEMKTALVEAINVYLEMLELEKQEKQLFLDATQIQNTVTDFDSGCRNIEKIREIADKDLELMEKNAELNEKNINILLNHLQIENIDLLILDIAPLEEITLYPDMYEDIELIEMICLDVESESA